MIHADTNKCTKRAYCTADAVLHDSDVTLTNSHCEKNPPLQKNDNRKIRFLSYSIC